MALMPSLGRYMLIIHMLWLCHVVVIIEIKKKFFKFYNQYRKQLLC